MELKKSDAQTFYIQILGNAEEEFVFLIEMALESLRLNMENQSERSRKRWGRGAAKDISRICRKYLDGVLPSNDK